MIRKILLFCVFALAVSCNVQYDGDYKLIVEGNLVDKNGNPSAQKRVEITVNDQGDSDLISNTVTDANGHVFLAFPKPSNDVARISVRILEDQNTLAKSFVNLHNSDFTDYKFDIPKPVVHLKTDVTSLNIHLEQMNFNNQVATLTVDGIIADLITDYHPDDAYENLAPLYPFATQFSLYKNQSVTLHYSVLDQLTQAVTEHVETIIIGDEAVNYTVSY